MINQILTLTASQLNNHTVNVLSGIIADTTTSFATGITDKVWMSPREIQFINKTGSDVKINILSNPDEVANYAVNPSLYPLFTIAPSSTTGEYEVWSKEECLPTTQQILVYMPSGVTATGNFVIEQIDFTPIF